MQKSILRFIASLFTPKDPSSDPHPDHIEKIETVQDAMAALRALYSSHDLKRCEEISDLLRTLKAAHTCQNPACRQAVSPRQIPVKTQCLASHHP